MEEHKKYKLHEESTLKVEEPVVAYGIQVSASIPCMFTEEEFREEIRLSEVSGYASDMEVEAMFAKWKIYM